MSKDMTIPEPTDAARMQSLLTTFRQVGLPLLQALTDTAANRQAEGGAPETGPNTALFNALVDSTVTLSQKLAATLGASDDQVDAWVRWALVGASSQVVAANFKSTGQPMAADEADRLAAIAVDLQNKLKTPLMPADEPTPNTAATFRAKMMEAMVPVVGALAQYSFGRSEHALLAEVAEKLVKTADQVTRALAPAGSTPEQWRLLCWHVLRAAGQIYTESHYAEADRLLYMNPDERTAYFAAHGNVPPMTQVWQAFNQRMAMLATLATYLEVPASVQMQPQPESWQ
jgi:hypothetical protein